MHDRWDRDVRNRGELSGDWARDEHRGGMGDLYARDGGWSGGGRHDQYARDDRPAGHGFRGKAPKAWSEDDRLCSLIKHRLTDHDGIDPSDVEVAVANGEVTLTGTAGSRWEKRLAEDLAWQCGGVRDVHNRLTVADRERQIGKSSE